MNCVNARFRTRLHDTPYDYFNSLERLNTKFTRIRKKNLSLLYMSVKYKLIEIALTSIKIKSITVSLFYCHAVEFVASGWLRNPQPKNLHVQS